MFFYTIFLYLELNVLSSFCLLFYFLDSTRYYQKNGLIVFQNALLLAKPFYVTFLKYDFLLVLINLLQELLHSVLINLLQELLHSSSWSFQMPISCF